MRACWNSDKASMDATWYLLLDRDTCCVTVPETTQDVVVGAH